MKKMLSVNNTSNVTDIALLAARLGITALMLTHGIPKLMMLISGAPVQFPSLMGMSSKLTLALAVFAELFCSLLILAGFATRLATIPLIITMIVAVFVIHAADPFSKMESGLHYMLVYAVLLISGSGKYSVDYLICQKSLTPRYSNQKSRHSNVPGFQ